MPSRPPRTTLARLSLTALLLLPACGPAQTAPASQMELRTARATCEQEFAAGRWRQALPACQAVLRSAEQAPGLEEENIGHWLLIVGRVLQENRSYAAAVPLVQRALHIMQKVHGDQHPDVAASLNSLALLYEAQGQSAQAEPLFKRSLAIVEKALGADHPDVAISLNNLAELYRIQGQSAQAEPLLKRSLAILEKTLGADHPDVAASLNNLALLYEAQGHYTQAEPLLKRSLAIREKALGADHPDVAGSLNNLAALYEAQGQYAQVEPLLKRSLAIREKALGADHPDVAGSLNNLAALYEDQGQYAQVELQYKRSLAIVEKALGADHPDVAASLNNLALLYEAQGHYTQAEPLLKRSLAIREKALGADHPDVAASLNNLALLYEAQGHYTQAEPLLKRSLAIREKALGADHPDVAASLNNLALLYEAQGHYTQAEPLLKRSLAIREKALGADHPDVAASLNNLSALYEAQDQHVRAELLSKRSLAIKEKALGADHPDIATSLNNLAQRYHTQGQYARAEPLFKRSLAIREGALGPDHRAVATSLNNLAALYEAQGQYAQAEPLLKRSLAIVEKALGADHPTVATSLNNLAALYEDQGQSAQAELLYKRSLAIVEKALGADHPDVAAFLNNLAELYRAQGQYAQAEPLYQRSLAIIEKALGPDHRHVAVSLNNLALLYETQGQYAQAEPLFKRSLASWERALGPEHHGVAARLKNLAALHLAQGQRGQALPRLQRAVKVREAQVRATVSETRMQALLDTLRAEEDMTYGLLLGAELPGVKELALQVVLLRKGRVAAAGEAANRLLQRARSRPEVERKFQEWQGVRQQHEALLFGGLGALSPAAYRQRLQQTQLRAEALEAELAIALPELRALQPPKQEAIIADVAKKLPKGSALVEVVWVAPYQGRSSADGKRWGPPRYVALLLFPDRRIEAVDLGPAAAVDTLALELQTVLASPGSDPVAAAKRLHTQVMGRLLAKLGKVRDLYLSLDGTLNTIPFDALHDGRDYLLGRYRFHYLTSGRDLLRERSQRVASAPLLLANPEFGQAEPAVGAKGDKTLYQRLAGLPALPGTLREAEAIAALLGIKPLVGAAAREEAVRGSAAPRILHIATHGLFLRDVYLPPPTSGAGEVRSVFAREDERSKAVGAAEAERLPGEVGAMNRSALVLADAARGGSAKEAARDGLLTADEARSLDLDGTQLVVLSACETGRGGLSAGQGVYGLRRAFLVAGAETLVTSLWRVNDQATGELMPLYYQKLLDPKKPGDRLGAMVEAMQELRAKAGRSHPYYWAPFLVIGSDGPLRTTAVSR